MVCMYASTPAREHTHMRMLYQMRVCAHRCSTWPHARAYIYVYTLMVVYNAYAVMRYSGAASGLDDKQAEELAGALG